MTASPSSKPLTAKAQANLDNGGVRGPGTNVCAACTGAKEPSRINSSQCRACGDRKGSELVRVPLPRALRDRLVDLAEGASIAEYIEALLDPSSASPSRQAKQDVTPAEWAALLAWVRADPARLAAYPGPKGKTLSPIQRADLYIWAVAQGMKG